MSLLLKNTENYGNVYIEEGRIAEIDCEPYDSDATINAAKRALVPGFVNTHTHAAMTLLRGYADDLPLLTWLSEWIWPLEAKMTGEDIYWGTKLACLEMIKTGTTTFNDMYWHVLASANAVDEMGIRSVMSNVLIDTGDESGGGGGGDRAVQKETERLTRRLRSDYSSRVIPALGPHAIYTVSEESLAWAADFAREKDLLVHIHVSETEKEVSDCIEKTGLRPVEYLDRIGFLGPNVIAAHCVWLNDSEIALLAKHDVKVSHNPTSNMKLAVGRTMDYPRLSRAGVNVSVGTDGCASNNNLNMLESAKFASLSQKASANDPTMLPARDTLAMITKNGAEALRIGSGEIKEGAVADVLLIDLQLQEMVPLHNLDSNLIYASHGCVDTTICAGSVLMEGRKVAGEADILKKASEVAHDLAGRR